jgi:hypothetical protein
MESFPFGMAQMFYLHKSPRVSNTQFMFSKVFTNLYHSWCNALKYQELFCAILMENKQILAWEFVFATKHGGKYCNHRDLKVFKIINIT